MDKKSNIDSRILNLHPFKSTVALKVKIKRKLLFGLLHNTLMRFFLGQKNPHKTFPGYFFTLHLASIIFFLGVEVNEALKLRIH